MTLNNDVALIPNDRPVRKSQSLSAVDPPDDSLLVSLAGGSGGGSCVLFPEFGTLDQSEPKRHLVDICRSMFCCMDTGHTGVSATHQPFACLANKMENTHGHPGSSHQPSGA